MQQLALTTKLDAVRFISVNMQCRVSLAQQFMQSRGSSHLSMARQLTRRLCLVGVIHPLRHSVALDGAVAQHCADPLFSRQTPWTRPGLRSRLIGRRGLALLGAISSRPRGRQITCTPSPPTCAPFCCCLPIAASCIRWFSCFSCFLTSIPAAQVHICSVLAIPRPCAPSPDVFDKVSVKMGESRYVGASTVQRAAS